MKLSKQQKGLLLHWLIILILAEIIFLFFRSRVDTLILLVALAFLCGFLLRLLKLYPGKPEPLILDFLAVVFALILFLAFKASLITTYILMFSLPVVILPHIVYILSGNFNE